GHAMQIPDLNQDNFGQLTLTRQIQQVRPLVQANTVLIGSSFGGLTACWLAEHPDIRPKLQKLILLAPAFDFLNQWLPRLGQPQIQQWQTQGWLKVYHYAYQQPFPLNYGFITDAEKYTDDHLQASIPTLILHGQKDEVITIAASRAYARDRPWVTLIELDTDHGMADAADQIWQSVRAFCDL
ncbi:MAG: YqiA/YcfP family alpha/beta fold hydrolase, partial [Cyanobacteria bacterium P01_F01_bin.4]